MTDLQTLAGQLRQDSSEFNDFFILWSHCQATLRRRLERMNREFLQTLKNVNRKGGIAAYVKGLICDEKVINTEIRNLQSHIKSAEDTIQESLSQRGEFQGSDDYDESFHEHLKECRDEIDDQLRILRKEKAELEYNLEEYLLIKKYIAEIRNAFEAMHDRKDVRPMNLLKESGILNKYLTHLEVLAQHQHCVGDLEDIEKSAPNLGIFKHTFS